MLSWDEPLFARPQERPVKRTDRSIASPDAARHPAAASRSSLQSSVFNRDVAIAPVKRSDAATMTLPPLEPTGTPAAALAATRESQAAPSNRRVRVEDKFIINGASDVNQL